MKLKPIIIEVDFNSIRKRVPPVGGAMKPRKGKGSYKRKPRNNERYGD